MSTHRLFHDEKERIRWQNPDAILAEIGLRPGLTFMDIGCGDGFFTIPAGRIVGEAGRVYALDINPEAIGWLRKRVAEEGLGNIVCVVGRAEDTVFCELCADIVFFSLVLHDFGDPVRVASNAKRMLKPTGILVDLDWKKEPMELGPPLGIRFNEMEAVERIGAGGFRIEAVRGSGLYHYLIIAKP